MNERAGAQAPLPERAHWGVAAGGLLAVGLGLVLSPATIQALGPMRRSLTSDIESVRRVAELEVLAGRLVLGAVGFAALAAWLWWGRLRESRAAQAVARHRPAVERPALQARSFLTPGLVALGVGVGLVLLYAALGARLLPNDLRRSIEQEDGLLENATAAAFLLAGIVSAGLAVRLRSRPRRVVHAVLAVGFLLCVGEEVSWGQRLVGFHTPGALEQVNVQGEVNLHNSFGYAADHAFIALVALYGVLLPAVTAASPWCHRLADRLGLPVPSLGLAAGFLAVSLLHDWSVYRVLPAGSLRMAEARELLAGVGLAVLQVETWVAMRPVASSSPEPTAGVTSTS